MRACSAEPSFARKEDTDGPVHGRGWEFKEDSHVSINRALACERACAARYQLLGSVQPPCSFRKIHRVSAARLWRICLLFGCP